MARTIQGDPETYEEAVYLLDRNRITVQGARTRDEAIKELEDEYPTEGDDTRASADEEVLHLDYTEWNVDQLKAELDDRDLSTGGNKADLVARLEEDDAENDEEF